MSKPVFGTPVAETDRPLHADRPLPHVQLAEVAPVEVVGEAADDIGVDVGHREDHVGRITVCHNEFRVWEDAVEVVQRKHMRGDFSRHAGRARPTAAN